MYVNEATERRLQEENKTRAPIIKQITDAVPMFKEGDFDGWTTQRITDLADRIKSGSVQRIDNAYAKVGAKGGE